MNAFTSITVGTTTFLKPASASGYALDTTGNVNAQNYRGDSYFLSNLTLNNIINQGNIASNTVIFNKGGTSFVTLSNVGISNEYPIHTLDVGSNLYVDDTGTTILVVTGNTFTSRKASVGSNLVMDTLD